MPKTSARTRQLVVVTDEPDYDPSCIGELQRLAREKKLAIKVLYSFNRSARPGKNSKKAPVYGGRATRYVVVDVMKIREIEPHLVKRGEGESGGQLDWGKVASAQGARSHSWEGY